MINCFHFFEFCEANVFKEKNNNLYSDVSTRPGQSGLSLVNFMLPDNYSELINHMAVTVLGCKLSLANLFSEDPYVGRTPPIGVSDICRMNWLPKL